MEPKKTHHYFSKFSKKIIWRVHHSNRDITEEAITQINEIDKIVDAMETYPAAEHMLNDLFKRGVES